MATKKHKAQLALGVFNKKLTYEQMYKFFMETYYKYTYSDAQLEGIWQLVIECMDAGPQKFSEKYGLLGR